MASNNLVELIIQAKDLASNVFSKVQQSMGGMSNAGKGLQSSLKEVETVSNKCQAAVNSVGGACISVYGTIVKLGLALGGAGLVKSFVEINASAERTKIMLGSLYGSTEKGNEVFRAIQEEATKVPFTLNAIQDSFVKLKSAGIEPTNGSFRVLADSVAMFGGSDEALKGVTIAIQQMAGKGVISMEELRQQLGEKIPTAVKAMATGLGMSMEQLMKEVESGSLSAAKGLNAMLGQLDKMYGGQSQKMMTTWAGLISNVKVAWEQFVITLGETGIFDRLKGVIAGILDKFTAWGKDGTLQVWIEKITGAFNFLWDIGQKVSATFTALYAYLSNTEAFKSMPEAINAIWQALMWVTAKGVEFIKWLGDLWKELEKSTAFSAFTIAVSDIITVFADLFNRIAEGFSKIGAMAGEHFGSTQRWIQVALNVLSLFLSGITSLIKGFVGFGEAVGIGAALVGPYLSRMADSVEILSLKFAKLILTVTSFGLADTSGFDTQIAALERHKAGIDTNIDAMLRYEPAAQKAKAATSGLVEAQVRTAAEAEKTARGIDKVAEASKKSAEYMTDNKRSYEEWLAAIKPGTAQFLEMEDAKLKGLEKTSKASIGLYKQQYEEGIISARRYYDLLQQAEDAHYRAKLKNINDHIDQAKQGGEKEYSQVAKYEAEKTALVAEHEAETQKLAAETTKAQEAELQKQVSAVDEANKKIAASNASVRSGFAFQGETMADSYVAAYEFMRDWARAWGLLFTADMKNINIAVQTTYKDTINTVKETISGVTDAFSAIKNSGIETLSEAQDKIKAIQQKMNVGWIDFYYYMKDLGKGIAASVGMTAEEWVRKLADYIAYVKGLMQSLKDLISSYQDQLDSLRGNEAAILDRWYAAEIQKLKDKFGEELRNTQDYHDALLLLQQLYLEKKKRLEEEAEGKPMSDSGSNSGLSPSAGASGGGSGSQWLKNFIPDMSNLIPTLAVAGGQASYNVTQEMNIPTTFTIQGFDKDSTVRLCKDVIFPEWEKHLKLKGINL